MWLKKYEMHFSVVLHSWDPSFCATSFKRVLPVYNHQDGIVHAYMYVIEQWVKAKVAEFSIARLEFSLLYLPHTFDSLHTAP